MKKLILPVVAFTLFTLLHACVSEELVTPDNTSTTTTTTVDQSNAKVGAAGISGVNWADGRDNFVDGWVIPSGLTSNDSYNSASAKADAVVSGIIKNLSGVNTIRLPINPPSVAERWWGSYTGAIDKTLNKGMKVILACWESSSSKDGRIDNNTAFWKMWTTVIKKYGGNNNVYFEVFNEPHGYSLSQLTGIYAEFLSKFPNVPRGRILLSGTGYSENVTGVGADKRFSSCLLSLHNYAWWGKRSTAGWEKDWRSRMGNYKNRIVVTEFGAPMSTRKDYRNGPQSENEIAYIVGGSNVFRNDQVASVYWPGLRDDDSYSLLRRGGSGNNITISTVNASGVFRVRFGWGLL
ncbi:cellulase family glycosylhydrolase [Ohtaekwangia koreensis]|uniref:Cellulase (Glycosyl hydrolase family 5) n=1 Tax=Ohtaekwangia koreensis TaxID=688867 RepID=A0A1T5IY06_9BACT|nr:cellulase family glycosylhydrolase [Ohtaekwangia koreensis]SKC44087.1 Cellulase (glycosyl hydrolase family 5) [Ohtaekwangia koreensis]